MGGSFFGWSYRGQSFEDLIESKSHPILEQPNHVLSESVMLEVEVARLWGIVFDPDAALLGSWLTLSRETRALKVAQFQLSMLGNGLREFDSKGYWEKYYADKKPPPRGRGK